jgi:putative transposase
VGENSKCAYQESFRDLDRALRDFIKSRKGQRKGKQPGFPRFKKRGKCRDSFRFGAGVMRCAGATVALPRLGAVRTHEDTGKLASRSGRLGAHPVRYRVPHRPAVVRLVHRRGRP